MEQGKLLPLGSIIIAKGSIRKIMIIGRGLLVKNEGKETFYEYSGCYYPDGLVGEQVMYFNQKDISEIIFQGYQDEDNERILSIINEWKEKNQ